MAGTPDSPLFAAGFTAHAPDELHAPLLQEEREEAAHADTPSDAPTPPSFARLLRFARPEARWISSGLLILLLRLPFSLAMPHYISAALAATLRGEEGSALLAVRCFAVAGALNAALDFGNWYLFVVAQQRLVRRLRSQLFSCLLSRPLSFFDTASTGTLLSRLTSDCSTVASDLTWVFRWSLEAWVRTAGISGYLFASSPRMGALAWVLVPVTALANRAYGVRLSAAAKTQQDALASASGVASESLASVRTVAACNARTLHQHSYDMHNQAAYRAGLRQGLLDGLYYAVISSLLQSTMLQGALLLCGIVLVLRGELAGERFIAIMFYSGQLVEQFGSILNSFSTLYKTSGAASHVFALLDAPHDCAAVVADDGPLPAAVGAVAFQDVRFSYPGRASVPVLNGVTFSVQPGHTCALVGPSGAGKSSCFALLEAFYGCDGGHVTLDGVDVRRAPKAWLHGAIALVAQEPVLFACSVAENILYSRRAQMAAGGIIAGAAASTEEMEGVIAACTTAHAHTFVSALPAGYSTLVGERGVALSGGQRQRLAIARAVYQDPRVLLLDEATNSLDAESERLVQAALNAACAGRTVLVIAHRLGTVVASDEILVLAEGQVVERGRHAELMSKPLYSSLAAREPGIG